MACCTCQDSELAERTQLSSTEKQTFLEGQCVLCSSIKREGDGRGVCGTSSEKGIKKNKLGCVATEKH